MRKIITFLAMAVAALAALAVVPFPNQFKNSVSLTWDYDTNSVPDVFKLYSGTDLLVPMNEWPLVATVSGNVHNITVSNLAPQQAWFYVTASNWFGESVPSNLAGVPQPPSAVSNLRISQ